MPLFYFKTIFDHSDQRHSRRHLIICNCFWALKHLSCMVASFCQKCFFPFVVDITADLNILKMACQTKPDEIYF